MRHAAAFILAFFVGVVLAPAEARPPNQLPLSLMLNGEPVCDLSADGGCVRFVAATTAVASATVTCGAVYKISCPSTGANVCYKSTDAGCSALLTDLNYGDPVASGSYAYVVLDDCAPNTTKTIYAVGTAGAGVQCPIARVR